MIAKIRSSRFGWVFFTVAGTFLMAIGLNSAFEPNGIADGGFSGIAIVIRYLTKGLFPQKFLADGIPLWITNLLLNMPLFLISIRTMGFRFLAKGIFGSGMLSFWLAVLPAFSFAQNDMMMAALAGGALMGSGLGLILMVRASTGGTDMIALVLHRYVLRHIPTAQILRGLDAIIILLEGLVFGVNSMLYSIVALIITTKVADTLLEGLNDARTAFIITEHPEEVANGIIELNRGVTGIHAMGMYERTERVILMSVVDKKQIVDLEDLIYHVDPSAFVIISDAREVLGEGFIEDYSKKLA